MANLTDLEQELVVLLQERAERHQAMLAEI